MPADKIFNFFPLEQSRIPDGVTGQRIEQKRFENSPQPFVRRNVESLFLTRQNLGRELTFHQTAEYQFELGASNFEILGKPRSELNDAMVEEGRAHLKRVRHAHAVALI
jgi:hypothetical protein